MINVTMHFLIIKHGALGDVVRTSYFALALKNKYGSSLRLSWITSSAAKPLLKFNPSIDDLWVEFPRSEKFYFDRIFSLDDEYQILKNVMQLNAKKITGAYLDHFANPTYTDDAATWFDMGLLSKFGKEEADKLKIKNVFTHGEIFSRIFNVDSVEPHFYNRNSTIDLSSYKKNGIKKIGINPYAGGRWGSKELKEEQLELLVCSLLDFQKKIDMSIEINLLGLGKDRIKNLDLRQRIGDPRVLVPNTESDILTLAEVIKNLDLMVTSDSLAMHLAIAQKVKFVAFFAPTSANEIDDFGLGIKIKSSSSDYCSYRPDADNSSITSKRIIEVIINHKLI